jgi:hypothetical protein
MASLRSIEEKIDELSGDYKEYDSILKRNLNYLADGRRKGYSFVVRANIRTLRSGPNRGKIRVDGALVVMIGNRNPTHVVGKVVRHRSKFLDSLDFLVSEIKLLE